MQAQELVAPCLAEDANGWEVFWGLVEDAALRPIRDILGRHNQDLTLADDVIQELFFYLKKEDYRRLRAFAGTTEPELRGYLGALAGSFAMNYVRAYRRARNREARALADIRQSD